VRVARLNTAVIDHDVYEPLPPKRAFTKWFKGDFQNDGILNTTKTTGLTF
jgi:hypothetical protein